MLPDDDREYKAALVESVLQQFNNIPAIAAVQAAPAVNCVLDTTL